MVTAVSDNYDKMKSTERLIMAIKSTLELIPEHSVGVDDCMVVVVLVVVASKHPLTCTGKGDPDSFEILQAAIIAALLVISTSTSKAT